MEEGECSSSLDFELNQLRGRLDRRNALLDIIRKAYHRDVLVVKENLQRRGNTNANDINSLVDDLVSVPSIDLRGTFRLFAPHECELRVRPCFSCGGQLEIIHRESARIVDFKYAIQVLQEREEELRLELVRNKVDAQKDRERLLDVVEKSKVLSSFNISEVIVSMKGETIVLKWSSSSDIEPPKAIFNP